MATLRDFFGYAGAALEWQLRVFADAGNPDATIQNDEAFAVVNGDLVTAFFQFRVTNFNSISNGPVVITSTSPPGSTGGLPYDLKNNDLAYIGGEIYSSDEGESGGNPLSLGGYNATNLGVVVQSWDASGIIQPNDNQFPEPWNVTGRFSYLLE